MNGLDLVSFSVYIFCGAVCLVLAILMFVMSRFGNGSISFRRIKQNICYSALLNLALYTIIVYYHIHFLNFISLDKCFVPMVYYFVLLMISYSIHRMIYSPHLRVLKHWRFSWVGILVFVAYVSIFIYGCKGRPTNEYIEHFHSSDLSHIVRIIINALAMWFFSLDLYWIVRASRRYYRRVNNYFSGTQLQEAKYALNFVYSFLIYVMSLFVTILSSTVIFHNLMCLLSTAFLTTLSVYLLMYENRYRMNAIAITILDPREDTRPENDLKLTAEGKVQAWISRADKPYLREGITLLETAQQMRLTSRILSAYINQICNTSFNMWINQLRIEEVKRRMTDSSLTLTEIAEACGFPDIASMSKIFKRFTGKSPSIYRKEL